ncbi:S1 family peptidase [Actinomadura sp. 9N215]|uniref:S1 family peptidase n=1 Tax=Actinomadura sp. 9N215 TaxID=3375150 RepID=UPI0037AA7C80
MRPVPLIMLVSGTAIVVATAPYMITQAPDSVSAPAPVPAPAPEVDPLPDAEPVPETDSVNEAARGGAAAHASGAAPARGRDGADGRRRGAAPGRAAAPAPGAAAPRAAAAAPGHGSKSKPGSKTRPGSGSRPGRVPAPDPGPPDDPGTGPGSGPGAPDPGQDPDPGTDFPSSLFGAPDPEGGETIFARPGGVRCTLGFNVRKSDTYYFLTTGACAEVGLKIYADPGLKIELGTVVAVTNSFTGLARYVQPHVERPGSVRTSTGSVDITAASSPEVTQRTCRTSPVTGTHCGIVTGVNESVSFPEGTIKGLARTSICKEPGDTPGAPYLSGTFALGLGIGASGNCNNGGSSYFQPVDEALKAFGVDVY